MAIRNIVQVGDEVLRKVSLPVTEFDGKLAELLDDMKETLFKANGAGLAAPQVGILKRVFIVYVDDQLIEFVNPKIVSTKGTQIGEEGCLSVKGKFGTVKRFNSVDVLFFDRNGDQYRLKAKGFMARAIQHEYDHLDGILYIDKAENVQEEK